MVQSDSLIHGAAPLRLLFVCSGNTCRSPMAEALARSLAPSSGVGDVEIRSAGTSALPGSPASGGARRAAHRHGLSLEGHSSSLLSPELVEWADVILAMAPSHVHAVQELGGTEKVVLLGAFAAGVEGEDWAGNLAVPDPFGGDDALYVETLEILHRYVIRAMKRMAGERE
jgi:protein-tyrosine-phosphatase